MFEIDENGLNLMVLPLISTGSYIAHRTHISIHYTHKYYKPKDKLANAPSTLTAFL